MTNGAKEFTITLDDVEYDVVVDDHRIRVNERPFSVEVSGEGAVLVDGIAHDVIVQGDRVDVDGEPHTMQVSGLSLGSGPAAAPQAVPASPAVEAGDGAVVAIMPGKVTRVLVEEGQEVEEGQPVCVLEAMKMENELRADRDGVVAKVHVAPGSDVEKGQVLVVIA